MTDESRQGSQHRPDWAALAIAVLLGVAAVVIGWSTATMPGAANYARIGPTSFPYAIAAVLFVLAVWTAVAALRGEFPRREEQNIAPMVWIVGGLAAQMLLLKVAGFSIATGLLFAATARGFGRGPLWLTIPVGIVLAFIIWIIFARGLQLSLPAGPLERLI
jgi:putative tricarboxylic transport membrane protein